MEYLTAKNYAEIATQPCVIDAVRVAPYSRRGPNLQRETVYVASSGEKLHEMITALRAQPQKFAILDMFQIAGGHPDGRLRVFAYPELDTVDFRDAESETDPVGRRRWTVEFLYRHAIRSGVGAIFMQPHYDETNLLDVIP